MSVAFVPERVRGKAEVNQETLQRDQISTRHDQGLWEWKPKNIWSAKLLEENDQLIQCIVEHQNKGRAAECLQHQHTLHRNLVYLAAIADAAPSPAAEKTAVED